MIKVAHVSDLHYSSGTLAEAQRCFAFAVDEAIRRGVDAAVISGDSTDHALDVHDPAVLKLAGEVRRLADHCPVLMLQGTYSHEPPGTLSIFRLLGGCHPVHVADRIQQVALTHEGRWVESEGWRFTSLPDRTRGLFTCVPTLNKATVAATVGATRAAEAVGGEIADLLAGYGTINAAAARAGVATLGVSHGTVVGCVTEHGVPMAGLDHEFTTTSLFSAGVQAFMLGHIHKHQHWEDAGRFIAYAGSIGRFHHGEPDAKGFLVWEIDGAGVRFELVPTPARRTVDLCFDGAPDVEAIAAAMRERSLSGAFVRVRWQIPEEDRARVDRAAIQHALEGAAGVLLEGRVVPLARARAQGISRLSTLAAKVGAWAELAAVEERPLLERLEALMHEAPERLVLRLLGHDHNADGDAQERAAVAAAQSPAALVART